MKFTLASIVVILCAAASSVSGANIVVKANFCNFGLDLSNTCDSTLAVKSTNYHGSITNHNYHFGSKTCSKDGVYCLQTDQPSGPFAFYFSNQVITLTGSDPGRGNCWSGAWSTDTMSRAAKSSSAVSTHIDPSSFHLVESRWYNQTAPPQARR